jgi:hypothetical protein
MGAQALTKFEHCWHAFSTSNIRRERDAISLAFFVG